MKHSASLQLENLGVDLEEFHLREIDLTLAPGEYLVILGPTGAGKTVLLEAIAGLHPLRTGRILLDDQDVTSLPPERRGVGFVYQDYMLFPHLSVGSNVAFGFRGQGLKREAVEGRVNDLSRLLGIVHLLQRKPGTLSGGEQQRVALARALAVEPRLLLLDEPLSALDPETREGLQRELARLHRELGTTTLHVTHDFEEAVALGDRIAVVNQGRIVQVGLADDIFRKPATEFVARFVGVRNIFQGHIHRLAKGDKVLRLDGTEVVVVTDLTGAVHGSVRPEDIVLSREPLRSSLRNTFRGTITDITRRGALVHVTVQAPPTMTCAITRRSLEEMALREGQTVYVAFKASAVHVF